MAKRKKRFRISHPEEFERLDDELSRALDNLAERNREAETSLGAFGSAGPDSGSPDDSRGATGDQGAGESEQG